MGRLARVVAVDVPHHLTQRGNDRRFILAFRGQTGVSWTDGTGTFDKVDSPLLLIIPSLRTRAVIKASRANRSILIAFEPA